ncbi:MAG: hypothetical protein OZSIB_0177 [Candidatus Ozemobacter sibiricus]|uniref:Uncharacterized protein n=1 Tax=Candidatus Ozemobacter sibiricus TaxID=2268124 RepID=A0A367ZMQ7_9BACT|nr:MAG: hypothetical protein OZSIB_0177 [Candidatus Ozemobacter sibiricus]
MGRIIDDGAGISPDACQSTQQKTHHQGQEHSLHGRPPHCSLA